MLKFFTKGGEISDNILYSQLDRDVHRFFRDMYGLDRDVRRSYRHVDGHNGRNGYVGRLNK
jgi:hypothetical protein